ncbi:OmpA family protein [Sneathiella limimaris]|uniref:OmpA family protein n=1 Tax=Sneathiella limimaris TaxID=1964213 RepID=UPI00146C5F86|nr:OmpA family protein [Sneathiella limimaris]
MPQSFYNRAYVAPLALLLTGLALSACDTGKYEELQSAKLTNGAFSASLAKEYRQFSASEIRQYDWPDQQHIALKGLAAAKGQQPLPEDPDNWRLSEDANTELHHKRADLIAWLNTDGRHSNPLQSARAQRYYDCWVEQKEENWQHDHIKACKTGLEKTLPENWQIQFRFDSAKLEPQAKSILKRIARDWKADPGNYLLIQGHTDKTGSYAYNYALSERRAKAAGKTLVRFGVPKNKLRFQVWGKERLRPSYQKANLIEENKVNRRVEIFKY